MGRERRIRGCLTGLPNISIQKFSSPIVNYCQDWYINLLLMTIYLTTLR